MCTTPQADLITPYDETKLAKVFLSASQRMLSCYSDIDMERPNASSLMIRYLQSNTLHYFGNTASAMHLLRCTWSLALTLRLHDEASLAGVDEIEAQLRRNMFWCMYQSDKSASLLSGAPSMVIGISLEEPITLAIENTSGQNLLNDSVISGGGDEFEQQIMVGFYLSTNIWKIGGDILADLKLINHMRARAAPNEPCTAQVRDTTIMQSYSTFCALMDDLPLWLHNPDSYTCREEALGTTPGGSDETPSQTHFRRRCLWAQKANLVITYHCLQLAIIRQAGKLRLCHLFGLTEDEPWLALRKLNITSDLLSSAKHLPLEALQANGEPCVSMLLSRSSESVADIHGCSGGKAASSRGRAAGNSSPDGGSALGGACSWAVLAASRCDHGIGLEGLSGTYRRDRRRLTRTCIFHFYVLRAACSRPRCRGHVPGVRGEWISGTPATLSQHTYTRRCNPLKRLDEESNSHKVPFTSFLPLIIT
jgi:hypothetical protein